MSKFLISTYSSGSDDPPPSDNIHSKRMSPDVAGGCGRVEVAVGVGVGFSVGVEVLDGVVVSVGVDEFVGVVVFVGTVVNVQRCRKCLGWGNYGWSCRKWSCGFCSLREHLC